MGASSLNETGEVVEHSDSVMDKLGWFVEGKVPKEEMSHYHRVLSEEILDYHKTFGRVLNFDSFELEKAREGEATRSAVKKILRFFEKWAA